MHFPANSKHESREDGLELLVMSVARVDFVKSK